MPISRQQLVSELLPALEKLFGDEYAKTHHIEYHMRCRYGKYSIYKWEFNGGIRKNSTTLAKHLSREEAIGMMKLLKDPA
jgi:hypothetical protein